LFQVSNSTSLIDRRIEEKMKAIVYTKYGPPDVLKLMEVAKPEPKDNQVLVEVHAASVNALDYRRFEKLSTMGRLMEERLIKSVGKALGADISGVVEAVGVSVKQFQPGDQVFGVSAGSVGGFTEYACAYENKLALKPANISFESAAAVPTAALTALQGLRDKLHIHSGQKVLIHGASGGVGTFSVQIAKSFGAEVTAVCSTRSIGMMRSIGADYVVDYTKEDFSQKGQHYDLIFAVNGNHQLSVYQRALNSQGVYVCTGGAMPQIMQAMLLGPLVSIIARKKISFMGISHINQNDLVYVGELLKDGKVVPVIDRCYPLDDVPAAIRYVAEVHARGKVVIQIS
jgi:NADPH:quinone reductase-like Zn-dependent oxidoreductase